MAYDFPGGEYGASATVVQPDSSHPDFINIPDADLLSNATFQRAGLDLHVHGHDGQHVVIPDYFAHSHHAALVAPNGERVSFEEIALLAGKYAEANPGSSASDATHLAGPNAIGHVDKIAGDVTVLRNGMTVTLHAGDAIYKSDVIQTGSGSSVAVVLTDGTALNLVANTRMALNEYSFDGSSGHALFTLQQGTFAFVAGKIGDMKIGTPVGFMSIHEGTTGWAHELSAREIAAISSKLGSVTFSFAVVNTADSHGVYELLVKGTIVGNIGDPNLIWYLDQDGNLISMPLDHSQEFADGLPRDFMRWIESDIATRSLAGIHGSGSPIDPSLFPQAVNLNQFGPTWDFDPLKGGSPFTGKLPVPNDDPFPKFHSNLFIWNGFGNWDLQWLNWDTGFPPTEPIDIVVIQSGKSNYFSNYAIASLTVNFGATLNMTAGSLTVGGLTNAGLIQINSSGVDPALIINGVITLTGHGTISMLGFGAGNFILGNPGTLFNVDNLIDGSGNIGAGDRKLTFINEAGGSVIAKPIHAGDSGLLRINTGNAVVNFGLFEATLKGELLIQDSIFNFGTIEALGSDKPGDGDDEGPKGKPVAGGEVRIEADTVNDGSILARGFGARVVILGEPGDHVSVDNAGRIAAREGGHVALDFTDLSNEASGLIVSTGRNSLVLVAESTVDNDGTIIARRQGTVEFAYDRVRNESDGLIRATGRGSEVRFDGDLVRNHGEIIAEHHGGVVFANSDIHNKSDGLIEADGRGSRVTFDGDNVHNSGLIEATHRGKVEFDDSHVDNKRRGIIEATGRGSEVLFDRDHVENFGLIEAEHHGKVVFERSHIDNDRRGTIVADGCGSEVRFDRDHVDNAGLIKATHRGEVVFEKSHIDNDRGGKIEADGRGAKVEFDRDVVHNSGRIEAEHAGKVAFERSIIDNERRGIIEADGWGSEVEFKHDFVHNSGLIKADRGGRIEFDKSLIGNDCSGIIEADGKHSKIRFERDGVANWGFIGANWGGSILFDQSWVWNAHGGEIEAEGGSSRVKFEQDHVSNFGHIEAERGGNIEFYKSHIDNERHGAIEADGKGSKVTFDRDHVDNSGHIEADRGAEVDFYKSGVTNHGRGVIKADGKNATVRFERDGIDNWGTISAAWGGSVFIEESWVRNERYGEIVADGRHSEVTFRHDHIDNSGRIEARHGGEVAFAKSHIDNHGYGSIAAIGNHSKVTFERDRVDNWGSIGATFGGSVLFDQSGIRNQNGGEIEADGKGSELRFKRDHITNSGRIEAEHGGKIDFYRSHVENDRHGIIEADGWVSDIDFARSGIENWGTIRAAWGGSIGIKDSWIGNGGEIEADGRHSEIAFKDDRVRNFGRIEAEHQGEVTFDKTDVDNGRHGTIEADGKGSEVSFERGDLDNHGTVEAEHHGEVSFDCTWIDNDGVIKATHAGEIIVKHSHVHNKGGLIAAYGTGSTVTFEQSYVHGGTLTTASGGRILTEKGTSTFKDLTISAGSDVLVDALSKLKLKGGIKELGTLTVSYDGKLDLIGATVDGGGTGVIHALDMVSSVIEVYGTDTLQDITVKGGDLIVEPGATLHLEKTVQLDGVHVDNKGDIVVDTPAFAATLVVEDGTAMVGGKLKINELGLVDVEPGSNALGPNGAMLDGVTVIDKGLIDIGITSAAVLTLNDGTVISGPNTGQVAIESGSSLDVEQGNGHGPHYGATLDGVTVGDHGTLKVGNGLDDVVLTLQGGAVIESAPGDGTVTIKAGSTIDVEKGTGNRQGFDAAIAGVAIDDEGAIEIGAGGRGAVLGIGSGAVISGSGTGTLTIHSGSKLDFEGGATLDALLVTDDDAFDVGDLTAATLTLQDGTVVSGTGTLTVGSGDTILIEPGSGNHGQGATFGGVTVVDDGAIDVGDHGDASLTLLDDVILRGAGTVTVKSGSTLDIKHGSGTGPNHGATIDGLMVEDDGALAVGGLGEGAVLTLRGGAVIEAAAGSVTIEAGSTIDVRKGSADRDGFNAFLAGVAITDKGAIEIETDAVLGIGSGALVEGAGTGTLKVHDGATLDIEKNAAFDALLVTNDGAFDVGDKSSSDLTLQGGTAISGTGKLTIHKLSDPSKPLSAINIEAGANGKGATFDGIAVVDNGEIDVGHPGKGAVLKLVDGAAIGGTGSLTVEAGSSLDVEMGGATLDGLKVTDSGVIHIGETSNAVLTLDDDTSIAGGGTGTLSIGSGSKIDIETGDTGTGATLGGVIVSNGGAIEVGEDTALKIGDTVTLNGSGAVTMDIGSAITDNGPGATLDNNGNTISGQGSIGGSNLRLTNEASGVIDANVANAWLVLDPLTLTNKGLLEATHGATLDIRTSVVNTNGHIEAHGTGSTVELEAITVTDGVIEIDSGSTLEIDNGTTILNNVDVQNHGNLKIDDDTGPTITATLVLGTGTSLDGKVTIGQSGELDVNGAIFGNIVIDDSGVFEVNGPLTLNGDFTIHFYGSGSFVDSGVLTIGASKSATLSGATFDEIDLGAGATLTLDNANAATVNFTDAHGTLVLDQPSQFTGTIGGLREGDIIDLRGVDASTVVIDGDRLKINGTDTSFKITGDLSGDTFAFKDDDNGGTKLKVAPQLLTVSTQPISGTESSAILVSFSDPLTGGATLKSVTISGIPAGATLSYSGPNGPISLSVDNGGTVTLTAAELAGLKITPADDTNFTLSFVAIAEDSDHFKYVATASETVTVSPLAPSVSWDAGSQIIDGEGETAAIKLNVAANGTVGDNGQNTITSVLISGIQVGATLTDGVNAFTADATHTTADVTTWNWANLTITPASVANFKLTATVTETDSEGETNTASADLKIITGTDWIAHNGDWTVAGDWDQGLPTASLGAAIDASVVNAANPVPADYTVSVHDAEVARALTVNDAHAKLKILNQQDAHAQQPQAISGGALTAGSLTIHNGLVDVEGGTKTGDDFSGSGISTTDGGSLTVTGAIVVDGGKLIIEAGTDNSQSLFGDNGPPLPLGKLKAGSIDVEAGGTVELDGTIDVLLQNGSGANLIVVNGGTLIVGDTANFLHASTLTFGAAGGTIKLTDSNPSAFTSPNATISGFGPGDVIDLPDVDYSPGMRINGVSYNSFSNTTSFSVGSQSIVLNGKYSANDLALIADGPPDAQGHQRGTQIVWGLSNATMTLSPQKDSYGAYDSITITVTILGPDNQPIQGVTVQPTFSAIGDASGGQGAFDFFYNLYVGLGYIHAETTDSYGQAQFTFMAYGYSGDYDISMLLDGVETLTKDIVVDPYLAQAGSASTLKSMLRFAGPQETAVLTLADRDILLNPRSGDTVTWGGNGTFSPGAGYTSEVTDAFGNLITVFDPVSNTLQTVSATFGDPGQQITLTTNVPFVTLDGWINANGGDWSTGANWSAGVVPAASHGAWIGVDGIYSVTVTAPNQAIYGLSTISTATLDIFSALTVNGYGDSVLAGALKLDGGTLAANHGLVELNGAVTNNGLLQAQHGAIVNVAGGVAGTGTISVDGATVSVHGTAAATQAITITGAGVVHLAQAEGGQITFNGAGMLALDAAPAAGMTVHNFGVGDSIDLTNLAWSANVSVGWDDVHNNLTVNNGTASETIHFAEGHSLNDFVLGHDPLGSGGIDVTFKPTVNAAFGNTASVVLSNSSYSIHGINNYGVAAILGGANDFIEYINGHAIHISGIVSTQGGIGEEQGVGINDFGTIALTTAHGSGGHAPGYYTATYNSSTNLNSNYGSTATVLSGPSQLNELGDYSGQGLGINNAGQVVGFFLDQRSQDHYDYAHEVTVHAPPPLGGFVYTVPHEYGFIYTPGGGYLTLDAGNAAHLTVGTAGVYEWGQSNVAYTVLTGINNSGMAVGFYMDTQSVTHSFTFNVSTHQFTAIPDLSISSISNYSTDTLAMGINDAGIVVGYAVNTTQSNEVPLPDNTAGKGFVYNANTHQWVTKDFQAAGVGGMTLTGINDYGMVTGHHGTQLVVANTQPIVTIDDGGTLYLTANTNETIKFVGPTGKLVISAPYGGQIYGFNGLGADDSKSDVIDLAGVNYVEQANWHANYSTAGVLTVSEAFGPTYQLNFFNYTGGFAFASDGHGGTLVYASNAALGPPTFSSPLAAAVNEGVAANTVVYTAAAADPIGLPVVYSLSGADASHFAIDPVSGVVTILQTPDFDTQSVYHFNVVADDHGFTSQQAVTLNINDLAPAFTSGNTASVNEGAPTSTVLYTASATDPGGGAVTYTLSGTDAAAFNINANSGVLTFKSVPSYDVQHVYNVTVVAHESAGSLVANQNVAVTVNALAPTFNSPDTASVDEGVAAGTTVYTAAATEPGGGTLSYSLVVGQSDDAAKFTIDAATGAVHINGVPDFDVQSLYHFTVKATELSGLSTTETVTLNINDVAAAPSFASGTTASVNEGIPAGSTVYTAQATEAGNPTFTYSLVSGLVDDAAKFNIDSSSGAVAIKASPNFETQSTYHFTVQASNALGQQIIEAVTLSITDINEYWNGVTADWSTANDWSLQVAPSTQAAIIDKAGTYTVTISGAAAAASLLINNANALVKDATGGALTLAGALTVNSGTFSLAGGSLSAGSITLGASGQLAVAANATLDGVTVNDNNTHTTDINLASPFSGPAGIDVANGAVLTVDDGTRIVGNTPFLRFGTLTVEDGGELKVTTASGATLDGIFVRNSLIDVAAGSKLTLTGGRTAIPGGAFGTTLATKIDGGTLTLENGTNVVAGGQLAVDGQATLSNMTVNAPEGEAIVLTTLGNLTLDHVSVYRANVEALGNAQTHGAIQVIDLGAVFDSGSISGPVTIVVNTNDGGLSGLYLASESVTVSQIQVASQSTLFLEPGSSDVSTTIAGLLDNLGTIVSIQGQNIIQGNNGAGGSHAPGFFNTGTLEIGDTLFLEQDVVQNSGGRILVDGNSSLVLFGDPSTAVHATDIQNGTLTIGVGPNATGASLSVVGLGNTIESLTSFTNNGSIIVQGGRFLGIPAVNTGSTLTLSGETLANNGSITVGDTFFTDTLTLTGVTITGAGSVTINHLASLIASGTDSIAGPLTNNGTVSDLGTLTLSGAVSGTGAFQIGDGDTLEFSGSVAGGTVGFTGTAGTLKIDAPASFNAVVSLTLGDASQILDLGGLSSQANDQFQTSTSLSNGITTLTVTDTTQHTSVQVNLAGDFTGASWTVTVDGSGGATVHDPAAAPTTIAAGETLAITSPWGAEVSFAAGTGTLDLNDPASFTGHIAGFTGTAPDAAHSDVIDVSGIDFNSAQFSVTFDAASGRLTVSDGNNTAHLTFDNFQGAFKFASDNHGGTLIFDPPAQQAAPAAPASPAPAALAAAGSDSFVFHPGMGAQTISNFDPNHETIALDQFAGAQTLQQLQTLITHDAHGDALIEFGHGDSLTLAGVTAQQLQGVLNNAVHLH